MLGPTPELFLDALILTGPTGSGKTALGLELAQKLDAEIISMDSMALYRGLDIASAKPTAAERRLVRHHLIDRLDPWESASVAWWLAEAARAHQEIQARGKRTLFVGGTPLYLKALLRGLFAGPGADPALRQRLEEEAGRIGVPALHARLAAVDPPSAAKIHPNDLRRIIRALEVWEQTGRPISAWQKQWDEPADGLADRCLCLDMPREELYARIDARVLDMIQAGLVEEIAALGRLPQPINREAAQAVGYREITAHLRGEMTLDEAVSLIQKRSRHFARRQLTWFRALPECRFVSKQLTADLWMSKIN